MTNQLLKPTVMDFCFEMLSLFSPCCTTSTTHLDIIAYTDVIRARHTVQNRNLEVQVGETHKGAQDCLSLYPWSLPEMNTHTKNKHQVKTCNMNATHL